jgi:hypothetical protein
MTADRIKEIQNETAVPDSVSVCQALMKVWNECEQERMYSEEDMTEYAIYIVFNNLITPKQWFEQFKKK